MIQKIQHVFGGLLAFALPLRSKPWLPGTRAAKFPGKGIKWMKCFHPVSLSLLFLAAVACGTKEPAAPAEIPAAEIAKLAGVVTGKVNFTGDKPTPNKIRMDSEKYCAEQHVKQPVDSDDVVVNDNGTLANVFVWVKEGLGDRTFAIPTQVVELDQKGCLYTPRVVGMMAGQPLEIVNTDETTHNVHPHPKNNQEWNVDQPPREENIARTFAREEIMIPVMCNIHPWMRAFIGVVKHPFFGVTGKDGTFTLKGLPAGEYSIGAWHEKYGTLEQRVNLAASDIKAVDFNFNGR